MGITPGTTTIGYTTATGFTSTVLTVVATTAGTITGPDTVCEAAGTTLANTTTGGTWTSSNTSVATIDISSALVTGVSPGTTTISYIVTATGCFTTRIQYVNPLADPGVLSGPTAVPLGATITLSSSASGGTWSSSNATVATVGSTGTVSGISSGTADITYAVSNSCGVSTAIQTITVLAPLAPISGSLSICPASTNTLTCASAGGTWTSSNTSVATIGSISGLVLGITPGTTIISYTSATGFSSAVLTVIATTAGTITGPAIVALGTTVTYYASASGGTWSSSDVTIATVGTGGAVSGLLTGTADIYYTVTSVCTTAVATRTISVSVISLSSTCAPQWMKLNGNESVNTGQLSARPELTVNNCGDAFLAMADGLGRIIVKKYDGEQYTQLGEVVDSSTISLSISLATDESGTPFVAYEDGNLGNKVTVKKYDGTSWVTVGLPGFSAGVAQKVTLKIDNGGNPWVAYRDSTAGGGLTVTKFTGTTWTSAGSAGFSGVPVDVISMDINHSGVPFVCYTQGGYATIVKFNGTTWDTVGDAIAGTNYSTMALDTFGIPYIVSANNYLYAGEHLWVLKFNGISWSYVGPAQAASLPSFPSIAIGSDNNPRIVFKTPVSGIPKIMKFNSYSWEQWGSYDVWMSENDGYSFAISNDDIGYLSIYYPYWFAIVTRFTGDKWELQKGANRFPLMGLKSSVKVDHDGVPYVIYIDNLIYHSKVKKYVGNEWTPVGEGRAHFPGTLDENFWRDSRCAISFDSSNSPYAAIAQEYGGIGVRKFNGANWEAVGPANFDSTIGIYGLDIAVSPSGTPYVMFESFSPDPTAGYWGCFVRKYNGTNWVDAWNTLPLPFDCDNASLAFDSAGMLYISFVTHPSFSRNGSVWKFDGDDWAPVGDTFCTPYLSTGQMNMAVSRGGTPYVIFRDADYGEKATVRKFDGSAWVTVGSPGFSPGTALQASITIDNNDLPYVIINDASLGTRTIVMRFNGVSWETVGDSGFSEVLPNPPGATQPISIAVDPSGIAYASYTPIIGAGTDVTEFGTVVMKYGSPAEIYGDMAICEGMSYSINSHGGGSWSSSNPSVASVNCTGLVKGISAGIAIITYTYDTCYSTVVVTVNATPDPGIITGPTIMMIGTSTTFSSSASGGIWSTLDTSIATVLPSGLVSAINYGTATIKYTVATGSCSASTPHGVIVNATGTRPATDKPADPMFTIAPNPTQRNLRVTTNVAGTLMLYSLTGQRLEQYTVPAGSAIVSMPRAAPPGIYLMRFQGDDGTSQVARVSYQP
jgi:uncharacterized protein YjdB